MSKQQREVRFLANAEVRAKSDGSKVIQGYAAMFNSPSQDLGGFIEVIKPGAFTRSLANGADVRFLFNHDANFVLGRTTAGTLRLTEDNIGLRFECDLPDTQTANDLHTSIKRGDINQCSFGFYCIADNWVPTNDAPGVLREVLEANVFDCSAVTFPAYEATSLSARSLFPDGKAEIEARMAELTQATGDVQRRQKLERVLSEVAEEQRQQQARDQAQAIEDAKLIGKFDALRIR
jgi:uncharacterized protein